MITTLWGYDILTGTDLPAILTLQEFNTLTAGRYTGDIRIEKLIEASTAAVRNYVGWHLAGSVSCECVLNCRNGRCIYTGNDVIVQLPARFVTGVELVLANATKTGDEWSGCEVTFDFDRNGLLTIYDCPFFDRKAKIYIKYTAGVPDNLVSDIKELIAYKTTQGLANSNGVQSESTGGVSITYSASWANQRATSLPDECKEALNLYRLQGVF